MPFTWNKRNRFSQLVADHLQSPKRGGSLVVETGFPTSLIDLYVRNRGRFRKSSAKKHRANDSPDQSSSCSSSGSFVDSNNNNNNSDCRRTDEIIEEDVVFIADVANASGSVLDLNNSSSGVSDCRGIDEIIEEDEVVIADVAHVSGLVLDLKNSSSGDSDSRQIDEIIEEDEVVADVANASGSVLDLNLNNSSFGGLDCRQAIVVDGAEKSVGMAKLNPVLVVLFMVVLVFVTKRFAIGITLSAFLLFFLESVGTRLFGRSISIKPSVELKQAASVVVCSQVLEIEKQVDSKQEESVEVRSEVLVEIRRKGSRRAMMKSSIKKLVPKKLRTRKTSVDSKHEIRHGLKEEQTVKPLVSSNECLGLKGRRSLSSTLWSETEGYEEESVTELQQDFGCLVLFLIVLVGLIEGRVLALVMALSWCLMLKLRSRNVKFSIS